jgi:hypothetical protein
MNGEEFFSNSPKTSILLAANFGEGKTSIGLAFPKIFYIGFRQGGLEVIRQKKNEKYRKNLVRYEELIPGNDQEVKLFFKPEDGKIEALVDEAISEAKSGKIGTLFLDDLTDGVEAMQKYVWTFDVRKTEKGALDNQSMYGQLKINLSNLFDRKILPFRKYGNLIVTTHLMRETEQTIEGTKTRPGAVDKKSDIYPDIVGSFRREVQRKFENVIYLETKLDPAGKGKRYMAYTSKCNAFGTVILAKNVKELPTRIDLTNQSLYDLISGAVN